MHQKLPFISQGRDLKVILGVSMIHKLWTTVISIIWLSCSICMPITVVIFPIYSLLPLSFCFEIDLVTFFGLKMLPKCSPVKIEFFWTILTLIREHSKNKSKTQTYHRVRFPGKKSRAQLCINLYMFLRWIFSAKRARRQSQTMACIFGGRDILYISIILSTLILAYAILNWHRNIARWHSFWKYTFIFWVPRCDSQLWQAMFLDFYQKLHSATVPRIHG